MMNSDSAARDVGRSSLRGEVRHSTAPSSQLRFSRLWQIASLAMASVLTTAGCAHTATVEREDRAKVAQAMYEERCKRAGVFIHRTVKDVEGLLVMKVRGPELNYADQFRMDDPYGGDFGGEAYVGSFLREHSWQPNGNTASGIDPKNLGYSYVDAVDPRDGRRYRYTGRLEEPGQKDKRYLAGHIRFVVDKTLASAEAPKYAVTFDDLSSRQDREYWIAGGSLRVIDTQTGEVLAERIGYMLDRAHGSRAGGRSPWLLATDNACPSFNDGQGSSSYRRGSIKQVYQAVKFVNKVLIPKR